MALESAALLARPLARALASGRFKDCARDSGRAVAAAYARGWQRSEARKLWASAALARIAMNPAAVATAEQLLRCAPRMLTQAARMSGKTPHSAIAPGA